MLLRLEREQVVVTLQRNDFCQMLMHCMGLTKGFDTDHLRHVSETLVNYFTAAEQVEEERNRSHVRSSVCVQRTLHDKVVST